MHIPFDGLCQPLSSVLQGKRRFVIESSVTDGPQPSDQNLEDILAPNALEKLRTTGKLGRAPWAASLTDGEIDFCREALDTHYCQELFVCCREKILGAAAARFAEQMLFCGTKRKRPTSL
ncbi:hypothetical protein [Paraburkholderia hayleyella]|uniref:hypothetical protein n=1 Tax=Paraburkholderia hayleyella TaxID=2152889 RepID=UPI00129295D7|nr:hypothetical protein [Paraburkholderia hayleyella]